MKIPALITKDVRRRKVVALLCLAASLFLISPSLLFSQAANGRISGAVRDQTGGSVAGAMVTVTDVARGIARNLTTDESGAYLAPNLQPGTYTVRATFMGFQAWERTNISLEVGGELSVDPVLQPGAQTQTVTITEELPLVNTTSAVLGGTLSNSMIEDLPLNGRNYQNLLLLQPGTVINPGGNERQSTNGLRATDNVYLVEGLANDEVYTGLSMLNAPTLAGDVGVILPVDSIQEFGTEANPKAETGLKPGGVVNVGIKSGTNSVRGSAFAFGRGTSFNSRDYFNDPGYGGCLPSQVVNGKCPLAPVSLEQWGATAGGPLKKDKVFWFGAYEQQRYHVVGPLSNSTPVTCAGGSSGCGLASTDTQRSFTDALQFLLNNGYTVGPNNCSTTAPGTGGCTALTPTGASITGAKNVIAANSLLISGCNITGATAACNGGLFVSNPGTNGTNFQTNLPTKNRSDNGVGKLSYHINDKNNLDGVFYYGQNTALFNDASTQSRPQWESLQTVKSYLIAGGWAFTPNSTIVNELHAGLAHYQQAFDSADIGIPVTNYVSPSDGLNYSLNTGVTNQAFTGFPIISITGYNMRLGGTWPKYIGPDNALQFSDHVSYLFGKHTFKFGGELNRLSFSGAATTNSRGNIPFGQSNSTALLEFFTGRLASSGANVLSGDPFRNVHNYQYSLFGQDDWRIRPTVTLNLGVRWEYYSILKEKSGRFANFIPNVGPVQVGQNGLNTPYQPDYKNVSPRFGVAWDVSGNGKTVVRLGASLIYEQLNYISLIGPGNGIGLGAVCTGCATQIGGTPTPTPGAGNIAVNQANAPTVAWNVSTVANGITIFPANTLGGAGGSPLVCGDGLNFSAGVLLGLGPNGSAKDAATCSMNGVDPNLRTPYVSTWSLDLQRAITTKISLDVAYVGTHGTKLLGFLDHNQPPLAAGWIGNTLGNFSSLNATQSTALGIATTQSATLTTLANCYDLTLLAGTSGNALPGTASSCQPSNSSAVEQVNRPYTISCPAPIGQGIPGHACLPQWRVNTMVSNIDQSNYNAMQVSLKMRPTHGLSANLAYTWSHALDYASSNFGLTTAPDSSNAKHLQYGPSGFDRRNVFNLSTTYQFPDAKVSSHLLEQVVQGWGLNSIIALRGGTAWSPTTGDFSGTGDGGSFWNFYGNPNDFRTTGARNTAQDLNFFKPGNKTIAGSDSSYAINNPACTSLAASQVGPSIPILNGAAVSAGTVGAVMTPTNGLLSLQNLGCYVQNGSVLLPPAYGTWPQNNRGIFRGPSFKIWDLSVSKNNKFGERISTQFRVEFFNVLNTPTFAAPTGNTANPTTTIFSGSNAPNQFGSANQTLDNGGQNPVVGSGGPRSFQLGLKINF